MKLTKYKIISLSIIILFFANLNLLSQEESKSDQEKTTKSMIIGSVISNPPNRNYDDKSIGGHLSFRHIFSSGSGVSINIGYISYEDNEISKSDKTFTLGIHNGYEITKNNHITSIVELGIIYKDIEENKIRPLFSFGLCDFLHIYKGIGIEVSFKAQCNTYDQYYCNIGAGIAYSF